MSAGPPKARNQAPSAVSALFHDPADVDRALTRLIRAGVPRDLIEVVVSPTAAERYYPGRARPLGREAFRYAGVGGLIGLIVGAIIALAMIAWPGFADPGLGAIAQLLGPNLATVTGAILGALIGLARHRRPERRLRRATESPDSIVLVVTARSVEEERAITEILTESGGAEPRREE